jgi:hypothetical protein
MDIFEGIEIDEAVKKTLSEKFEAATKGLKAKADELLAEKKKIQDERAAAEEAARREAEDKAKNSSDYKQLFESQKQESERIKKELEGMREQTKRQQVATEAARLASALTKDTGRAKLLEQQFNNRLTLVEGQIKVTDDSGNLTVSTIDELTAKIKTDYPFLVDGNQSTGGGASRSGGRADLNSKQITRSDFDAMNQAERAKFAKEGGKVVE